MRTGFARALRANGIGLLGLAALALTAPAGLAQVSQAQDHVAKPESAQATSALAADLAKQALSHSASPLDAWNALLQAQAAVSNQSTLAFRKAIIVDGAPLGFGMYTPRANNVFKDNEEITVYLEPVGLHWTLENGIYHSLAMMDYELRAPDGKILAGQHGFGKMDFKSREQNQEVMYKVDLRFHGAHPGKYTLVLTCHEASTGRSASTEFPVEFQ
jgi:hypothetical protein